MTELVNEAANLQKYLEDEGFEFFFLGGLVVQVWGRNRLTDDIDLTVFTNLENEPEFIAKFLSKFDPKFSDADQFALTNRVLPMRTKGGIGIDLTLGGLSDTSEPLRRSSYQKFTKEVSLKVCSAEDLIVFKSLAARPQDWIDVEAVIIKQSVLEWEYIESAIAEVSVYDDIAEKLYRLHLLKDEFYQK